MELAACYDSYFLVSGSAEGIADLAAFDEALRVSGLGDTNLLRLSSILPPGMKRLSHTPSIQGGCFVPCAYASRVCGFPGHLIACAVAVAVPKDPSRPGLIMETSLVGSSSEAECFVLDLCEDGMRRRGIANYDLHSVSAEHRVQDHGAVFAGLAFTTTSPGSRPGAD